MTTVDRDEHETSTRGPLVRTRHNVWAAESRWADPVLWYARGVAAMKQRALDDPTSWRFYAAMHGFAPARWAALGYLDATDQPPSPAVREQFWAQCQHGSWYFLPWHRGYVLAFEANIRAEVVRLGGPDGWALPYWDYFGPGQSALPPELASPVWPDGTGDNPLFVPQRYGPFGDGNVFVPLDAVNLDAMNEDHFTGVSSGGTPGFGGVDTGFSHGGGTHGMIEGQPHDWVHGLVGGRDVRPPQLDGVMSDPRTAGLDPVFWLHHANIDRLWEVWNRTDPFHTNPTDQRWLQGPASQGERPFVAPMPDGTTWTYTPDEMTDIAALGYGYEDLAPAPAPVPRRERLRERGLRAGVRGGATVPDETNVELVGASEEPVPVTGSAVGSRVRLDAPMRRRVIRSLARAAEAPDVTAPPDRLFLNLENVRGHSDAAAFHVYVGVPDDEEATDHPEQLAGSIAPFGVSQATEGDDLHGGQGLTFVLEITSIVDDLFLGDSLDVGSVPVRIVPVRPIDDDAGLTIGRISIFRQGR